MHEINEEEVSRKRSNMSLGAYVSVYMWVGVHMYVCIYIHTYIHTYTKMYAGPRHYSAVKFSLHVCIHAHIHVCRLIP
jgi:hypothetical protein